MLTKKVSTFLLEDKRDSELVIAVGKEFQTFRTFEENGKLLNICSYPIKINMNEHVDVELRFFINQRHLLF